MALFTLAEITEQKAAIKAAMLALTEGKEITHNGKTLKREDLGELRKQAQWLDEEEQSLTSGQSRIRMNTGYVGRG